MKHGILYPLALAVTCAFLCSCATTKMMSEQQFLAQYSGPVKSLPADPLIAGGMLALDGKFTDAAARFRSVTEPGSKADAARWALACDGLAAYEGRRYREAAEGLLAAAKGGMPSGDTVLASAVSLAGPEIKTPDGQRAFYTMVLPTLKSAQQENPESDALLRALARAYEAAGQVDLATTAHELRAQNAEGPFPWVDLATFWHRQGKANRARQVLSVAIETCDARDLELASRLKAIATGKAGLDTLEKTAVDESLQRLDLTSVLVGPWLAGCPGRFNGQWVIQSADLVALGLKGSRKPGTVFLDVEHTLGKAISIKLPRYAEVGVYECRDVQTAGRLLRFHVTFKCTAMGILFNCEEDYLATLDSVSPDICQFRYEAAVQVPNGAWKKPYGLVSRRAGAGPPK